MTMMLFLLNLFLMAEQPVETYCVLPWLVKDQTLIERCNAQYYPLYQPMQIGQQGVLESDLTLPMKPLTTFFICKAVDGQAMCLRHDQTVFTPISQQEHFIIRSLRGSVIEVDVAENLMQFHAFNTHQTWMKKYFLNGVWGIHVIDNYQVLPNQQDLLG